MVERLDPSLTSLIVGEEHSAAIVLCLTRLMEETGATHIMLLDRAGQILSWQGGDQRQMEMMHLGALLAGTYATSREMARLLKEDGFRVLVQEGMREKIFTETVEDRWLLVVVFDHQAHLGLVKVLAKRATQSLAEILHIIVEQNETRRSQFRGQVRKAAIDTIDLLFNDDSTAESNRTTEKK
ncbi:MAG TPA: roadblock/LC7 domain-containing protein [Thermomicrobiales bacterium]|nr:roadblock/LC7 domain-containing protein [Thermomicrobiales bacterium]